MLRWQTGTSSTLSPVNSNSKPGVLPAPRAAVDDAVVEAVEANDPMAKPVAEGVVDITGEPLRGTAGEIRGPSGWEGNAAT